MLPRPPSSTLFPYTTLFRSARQQRLPRQRAWLEHQVRDSDLGHALVGTHRAPGRPGVGAPRRVGVVEIALRSEEHTSELQSHVNLVCRLLLEKKKNKV